MKMISAVWVIAIILSFHKIGQSQSIPESTFSVIQPNHISITYTKTTNLIFPYAIKSVDRGSRDVLVQKAKNLENILQVKAGRKNFAETNLTVITAEGKLYSYILNYVDSPSDLNFEMTGLKGENTNFLFSSSANEAELRISAEKVANEKKWIYRKRDKRYGIKFQLQGIYIKDNVQYYQISLTNRTNIDYDIEQLRFFIEDRKKIKRTASQEREIKPLFTHNTMTKVKGQSEHLFVFALPKFTIPDRKFLTIQLKEKSGGRNLNIKVYNKEIVKAKSIE